MIASPRFYPKALCVALCALLLIGWSAAQGDGSQDSSQMEAGMQVYENFCAQCHQPDGSGIEGQFPALSGNELVLGDPREVVAVPLQGPGSMPSFAETLTNEQIAAVVFYIRNAWENDADAVEPQLVAEVRQELGVAEPARAEDVDFEWQELGMTVYENNCAACHQSDGTGLEGVYPSFIDNSLVLADPQPLIKIPLNGRGGMPSFRNDLDNEQIAAVLSYIRNTWGNEASPIVPETVAEVRGTGGEEEESTTRPGAAD